MKQTIDVNKLIEELESIKRLEENNHIFRAEIDYQEVINIIYKLQKTIIEQDY